MIEISQYMTDMVMLQNEQRRSWDNHDTPENLSAFILEEAQELDEAIEKAMIGDSAFEVASEIGDIFYLWVKRAQFKEEVEDEVIAAVEYAGEIAQMTGLIPEQCVQMKVWRNDMKYLNNVANNGYTYGKGVSLSKEQWRHMGGDSQFSEMWLQMADQI